MSGPSGDDRRTDPTRQVTVRTADVREEAAQRLIDELMEDLAERYGSPDTAPPPHPEEFTPPAGRFVIAELDGEPVGCGGVRRYSATSAEIKRMYVVPGARGRGVARAILSALEDTARAAGYAELRLESGTEQPEALALYASAGFEPIEPYGYYAGSPRSRHLGKRLDRESSR